MAKKAKTSKRAKSTKTEPIKASRKKNTANSKANHNAAKKKSVATSKPTVKKRPAKKARSTRSKSPQPQVLAAAAVQSAPVSSTPPPTRPGNVESFPTSESNGVGLEERIRMRAYLKWQEAGCPTGDGVDFWLEAEDDYKGVAR